MNWTFARNYLVFGIRQLDRSELVRALDNDFRRATRAHPFENGEGWAGQLGDDRGPAPTIWGGAGAHQSVEGGEDEDQERGMHRSPTFAKTAEVGHPPRTQLGSAPFLN
jgi:hypothetical protein